jgi:hypothetical protein
VGIILFCNNVAALPAGNEVHYEHVKAYSGPQSLARVVEKTIQVSAHRYGKNAAQHVLVVLDDDNTLTTMPQFLGGVSWFGWQASLLKTNSPLREFTSFAALIQGQRLLFVLRKMNLTDASIPSVLQGFAARGVHVIVDTARGPSFSDLTQEQLKENAVLSTTDSHSTLFKQAGLINKHDNSTSYFANVSCPKINKAFSRPVLYRNGILFTTGQNKAQALQCLLHKLGYATKGKNQQYTHIVYMDDVEKLVQIMQKEYQHNVNVQLTTLHFTKYVPRDSLPSDLHVRRALLAKANKQYNNIMTVLHNNLAEANVPEK